MVVVLVQRLEQSVEVGDGAKAEARGGYRIHLRDSRLSQMRRRAQTDIPRLVDQRLLDSRTSRPQLETIAALRLDPAHPLAGILGRSDRTIPPFAAASHERVDEHAGRHDLVARAARLLRE
jgi:hypothetical protein